MFFFIFNGARRHCVGGLAKLTTAIEGWNGSTRYPPFILERAIIRQPQDDHMRDRQSNVGVERQLGVQKGMQRRQRGIATFIDGEVRTVKARIGTCRLV